MALLILCIFVNTLIGVAFKLFNRYGIDNLQAITLNYFVCVLTAAVVYQEWPIPENITSLRWFPYAIFMGGIFIFVFNVAALTVQKFGIVVASIFQKMSLLAPAIIAIIYFGEPNNFLKTTGILAAIVAIVLLSYSPKSANIEKIPRKYWILPIATFLGSCTIDGLLFLVDRLSIANNADAGFIASLFLFAGISGAILLISRSTKTGFTFEWKNVIAGILLGIPNFFSIYFLLLLLSKGWGGSVLFPINNVGILTLSAIFGFIIFKEKITPLKLAGFILSILAILFIANA